MLFHRDRRETTISTATPIGPKGSGGTGPSSLSLLLGMNEHSLVVAPRIRPRCAPNACGVSGVTRHSSLGVLFRAAGV